MQNELSKKAMLVDLSIRYWKARKYDKQATAEVAEAHGTTEQVGRYRKNLLPVEAESYEEVRRIAGNLRQEHYNQTLPWTNDGARILPAANYPAYTEALRNKRTEFDRATKTFLEEYTDLRIRAKDALRSLYKEEDYPLASEVQQLFEVSIKFFPLPMGDDFRVSLGNSTDEDIRSQIDRDTRAAITEGMKEPYRRLHVVVARMADRLSDQGAKFKNSLVGNIQELCDIIPGLNLTDDPEMTRMTDVVRSKLAGLVPDELRNDTKLRKQVAEQARKIESDLAGYMGGGG